MRSILSTLILLLATGCLSIEHKSDPPVDQLVHSSDAVELLKAQDEPQPEAAATSDTAYQEYMGERLKPIRANITRIDGINEWTAVHKRRLAQTVEGGSSEYYFVKDTLLKIIAIHFAETGKITSAFYTRNSELSFVVEKTVKYNRPITWDSTAMKESNDTEVFDGDSSEVIVDESYFENGVLIRQINNQDCGSPFAADYLKEEQVRLKAEFQKLKGRLKK